ncbi:MAG: D-sedoheptulose-7-phosphate isomerase [Actinomycetes bacterium]
MAESGSGHHVAAVLAEHQALASRLTDPCLVEAVVSVADLLVAAYGAGRKLIVFGNGGSAADAAHLAAEFVGRCARDRRALPAICLSDNTASVTSIANDFGYEQLFARQVQAFVAPGDVVIGLTTSGRSANVLLGLEEARRFGAVTVGLCGTHDATLRPVVEHCLAVPSQNTARVQETHLLWGHVWAELVEQSLGAQ